MNARSENFESFLLEYRGNDPVGDLANDFRRVRQRPDLFPRERLAVENPTDAEILAYLKTRAPREAVRAAWRSYQRAKAGARV